MRSQRFRVDESTASHEGLKVFPLRQLATSRKWLATFLAGIVLCSLVFFGLGYYLGYRVGYDAAYLTPVRMGYLIADIHQIAFFVAYYEGFYAEEGLRAQRLEYVNGPTEMLAFTAGDLDAGYVGVVPALIAKSKGADFVILASANLEGSAIVAKHEIETVEDLDGKKVGTPGSGTIQDSLLYMVETRFNIAVTRVPTAAPLLPLALERGDVDAYIDWEPFVAEAVVNNLGHVVYTSHDILPSHQCCVFYVSGKIFREQRDLAKRLLRVHVKAMRYVMDHPSDAMEIFANRTGKAINVVQESWQRMIWDDHLNTASMKTFVSYLIEQEKINAADVQNIEDFVNAAIDQQLLTELEITLPP